jgi:hypothetical protein
MSRPPRIANWVPWEKPTIYFITFCIESRKPVLANAKAWDESLSEKWEYLRQNPVRAALVKHSEDWPYQEFGV